MADEDEIDILSDFSLDTILEKSETEIYHSQLDSTHLNCDCSAPWSTDHAGHSLWDSNDHSEYNTELPQEHLYGLPDNVNNTNVSSDITDSNGWTKMEKNLLARGIEIFGRSSIRLTQFIGSKTSHEIKLYLKNFHSDTYNTEDTVIEDGVFPAYATLDSVNHHADNIILDDSEIPASIEEVIAVVTTAAPTVPVSHNSFKSNEVKPNFHKKRMKYKDASNLALQNKMNKLFKKRNNKYSLPVPRKNKQKPYHEQPTAERRKHNKNFVEKSKYGTSTWRNEMDDTMTTNLINIPNLNGEEVVKIGKEVVTEESASDIEIDVENLIGEDNKQENHTEQSMEIMKLSVENNAIEKIENVNEVLKPTSILSCDIVNDEVMQQLTTLEIPSHELLLEESSVSDLEKFVNKEFFCNKPTKNANRYLKIRNHILSMWSMSKPSYVTKTSARTGLKHCGDVNCISRIHLLLEQIGAINFGCSQLNYIRPIHDLFVTPATSTNEKINLLPSKPIILSRPRFKKKFTIDGEGGCTLTHDENGAVINTAVFTEQPVVKLRPYNKKPSVRLIYCKPFNDEHPQEYSVMFHLTTLLLMDLHAHTSHTEVMGLIGGNWNERSKKLEITRYVPCRNIAPSATHCDMCPISQAKAADIIHNEGFHILGWFHSHPTFAPEPSQQDMDTQLTVQQWIGFSKPCIGVILSPFGTHGALIASPFRCLIVDKKDHFEDQYVPYKFKIELISSNLDINLLLSQAWQIYNGNSNINNKDKVDFKRPYFLDTKISYLDKFISSVKMHLAKCTNVNKMSCDTIISGFTSICLYKT